MCRLKDAGRAADGEGAVDIVREGCSFQSQRDAELLLIAEKDEEGGNGLGALECTRAGVVDGDEEIGTSEKGERP